jgi:very-short-patch-repair endonuclease
MNAHLVLPDGTSYEIDALWRRERVAIELDSSWHDNPISSEDDEQRDHDLLLHGFHTERVRARRVRHEPAHVVAVVSRLLALGAASSFPAA